MSDNSDYVERIVEAFLEQITEAHWTALMIYAGALPPKTRRSWADTLKGYELFRDLVSGVKELAVEHEMRMTPVYEFEGWWTCSPTRRLAMIASKKEIDRNIGEAVRTARVYEGFGAVGEFVEQYSAQLKQAQSAWTGTLLAEFGEYALPSQELDWVVERVEAAVESGRQYVLR